MKINKKFIDILINHLMRKGKKTFAYKTIYSIGSVLSLHYQQDIVSVYNRVLYAIQPFLEVRKVRVRRTTYMVPFPVSKNRQKYLASKWFFSTLKENKNDKRKIFDKIAEEVSKVLYNCSSVTNKKYDEYIKAEKGRSFSHFRWY